NDAEIIEGNIDNEAYRQLISSSDLILLPYRKASFYARTSGVYADAVLAEKPVLATMETWIGRCVSKYRNGESFTDNDTDDLYRALLRLSADYKDKRDIYREARKEWLKDHNVANFVDTIKKAARLSDSGKPGKHTGKEPGKNNIVGGDELFDSHIVKLVDLIRQKNCLIGSNARDKDSVGQLKTSIKQLEDGLDEHRGIIRNLEQKVANREKTNKLLTQKIGERQNDIDKFREQIANRDRGLEVLRGNLAKRTEALEQNRDKAVREHKADITALRSKLSTRTEALEASRSQTANRDAALKTLRGKLDDRVEALRQSRLQVGNRNKAIEEFRSTIDTQNSSLYDINSSLRERETTIEKLDDQILHKNNELSKLIASLEKTENELESVYHSRTWRLSRFLVKIYHLLFGWVPRRKKK
ncbi:MAG: hypothetical protein GY765_18415, partial [bacterium]|nr:hypothetical protein [bacterium]